MKNLPKIEDIIFLKEFHCAMASWVNGSSEQYAAGRWLVKNEKYIPKRLRPQADVLMWRGVVIPTETYVKFLRGGGIEPLPGQKAASWTRTRRVAINFAKDKYYSKGCTRLLIRRVVPKELILINVHLYGRSAWCQYMNNQAVDNGHYDIEFDESYSKSEKECIVKYTEKIPFKFAEIVE